MELRKEGEGGEAETVMGHHDCSLLSCWACGHMGSELILPSPCQPAWL